MVDIGKYIWVDDKDYLFLPGKIIEIEDNCYKVLVEIDGEQETRTVEMDKYSEVHPSCLKGVDDLLLLGDFNQPTLLHNTRERFSQDKIYSFIGMPILIAVNPYKKLNIYSDKTIKFYKDYFNQLKKDPTKVGLPVPHLYHLAEAAYRDMLNDKKNQSLIISGESGSGKTESTKIILKYLAVSSLETNNNNTIKQLEKNNIVTVEKQVLDSNPLLEAFGNAKTVKNNNSSRFGKFIQVSFTSHGKILNARIYNYLLEKSRVVNISSEERNYHIFYQFLSGANSEEKKLYRIKDMNYYNYLNKGEFEIDDTDDAENFLETKKCMEKLTFTNNEINYIFSIIMGILYLGNINFIESDDDENNIHSKIDPENSQDFENAAYFLGISKEILTNILTIRNIIDPLNKKNISKKLNIEQSINGRDAIAKALYSKMFDYIVGKTNRAIANKEETNKINKNNIYKIGLLDIFGFENFDNNSFEQLCINYANERLQQYFNNHIFKLEQETYKKEGIDWTQVDFIDNNNIIELIDNGKISIFGLLDSEGITPNASDIKFKNNVYTLLKSNSALVDEDEVENKLSIEHFAGIIRYNCENFVEKNLDQLTNDISEALSKSENKLIKKLFESKEKKTNKNTSNKPNKLQSDTLSKQFKTQLDELLIMLSQSNPRYVKCIKPNSEKKPKILDSNDVMDQLLCAGVLEAIKIRKQGYNIRRTKEEFYNTYKILTPNVKLNNNFTEAVKNMLKILCDLDEMKTIMKGKKKMIQVGKNIVFMKEEIKTILDYKLNRIRYVYLIQSVFRAVKVRRKVRKYLNNVKKIQAVFRGKITRLVLKEQKKMTILAQRIWRFKLMQRKIKNLIKYCDFIKKKRLQEKIEENKKQGKNVDDLQNEIKNIEREQNNQKLKDNIQKTILEGRIEANKNLLLKNNNNNKNNIEKELSNNNNNNNNNNLEDHPKKKKSKTKKSIMGGLNDLNNDDKSLVDELQKTIESLQNELVSTKAERDELKKTLEESSLTANQSDSGEIKTLKKKINEKESENELLNLQMIELKKQNKNLLELTENLKNQNSKRKEKFEQEISSLYTQIQNLEIAKQEYERRLNYETKEERESKSIINVNAKYKEISDLRNENKNLNKKIDDLKKKYNNEINDLKNEITKKNLEINSNKIYNSDEFEKIKKENENNKLKLNKLLSKLGESPEMKIKKIENENLTLKNEKENYENLIEKKNKIENLLKQQLIDKESEINHFKKLYEDSNNELEKLTDENFNLKKNNFQIKNSININNSAQENKNLAQFQNLNLKYNELIKTNKNNEEKIENLLNSLNKRTKILENKKKMNLLLVDLAKLKKREVQIIETLKITNSSQLKESLINLRENEKNLLAQLMEVSKADQEMEDDLSGDEDDDEENEEEEENEDN